MSAAQQQPRFTAFEWLVITVIKVVAVSVPFVAVGLVNLGFGGFS